VWVVTATAPNYCPHPYGFNNHKPMIGSALVRAGGFCFAALSTIYATNCMFTTALASKNRVVTNKAFKNS